MERLLASEIDEVELFFREENLLKVSVNGGIVKEVLVEDSRGLGVRVLRSGVLAFSYTTDFSELGLGTLQERLETILNSAEPDPFYRFAEPVSIPDIDLSLIDDSPEETFSLSEMARELESSALRVSGVDSVLRCEVGSGRETVLIMNSLGVEAGYARSILSQMISAHARGAVHEKAPLCFNFSRRRSELFSPKALGEECGRLAVSLSSPRRFPGGEHTVIFSPQSASDLVILLEQALSGENVAKGRSFLKNSLDCKVASELVTLKEDPHIPCAYYSSLVDAEGVPTKSKIVIEAGVLRYFLHNLYSSAKLGVESTGNAGRVGYSSPPGITTYNLFIEPSDSSCGTRAEEMVSEVSSGLLVAFLRDKKFDCATGQISAEAIGWAIENGALKNPVAGVRIEGNLLDLLLRIDGVGNDLDIKRPYRAPSLRVEHFTISAD